MEGGGGGIKGWIDGKDEWRKGRREGCAGGGMRMMN